MATFDSFNLDKHFCMRSANAMRQLALPLQKYGITHFALMRLHQNGEGEILNSDPQVAKYFFQNHMYRYLFHGSVNDYVNCVVRWEDAIANLESVSQYIKTLAMNYDIANGIIITKKYDSHVDFYNFATTKNNKLGYSLYLNCIDVLESFIRYFNDQASDLLSESYLERYYLADATDKSLLTKVTADGLGSLRLECQSNENNVIMSEFYNLTYRERQCVEQLVSGRACKQIAAALNISPRTIEKFISNIKTKTNSKTLYQAIGKLI